ncbi:MAG TPA: MMPL family transporter [Acidimicrobiales bacterium]|nr:MMPL family transporter [Acidimicrobiales bacterium]
MAGIATTARVITSAALIMMSVLLAFVLGDNPTIKMLGIGLASAVFVDATIVRMVLVPATMRLMGDASWWLPRHDFGRPSPTLDDIPPCLGCRHDPGGGRADRGGTRGAPCAA